MGFTANLAAVREWQPLFVGPGVRDKNAIEGKLRITEKLYQARCVFYRAREIVEDKQGKIQKRW